MQAHAFSPNPLFMMSRAFPVEDRATPLREWLGVVALVLVLHALVGLAWLSQPEPPTIIPSEMSVSVAMQQAEVAQPQAQPEPSPPPKPQPRIERAEKPAPKPPVRDEAPAAPLPVTAPQPAAAPPVQAAAPAVAAAPVVDTEPDYKASYLNNPRPSYPMVARRMGWEGKVVLNVEVLATGACGDANVFKSSGHEALDNAALRTVKGWRFIPAKQGGRTVTQWFKVPINFSLEDNEA